MKLKNKALYKYNLFDYRIEEQVILNQFMSLSTPILFMKLVMKILYL